MTNLINASIRIGEMAIGSGDETLRTLLGSCVGVVLYDQRQQTAGLVHIQLPDSAGRVDSPPGLYVDTAIPELWLRVQGISKRPLRPIAHVAGGADMFSGGRSMTVGQLNIQAVTILLERLQIPVATHQCGGTQARRMMFKVATGTLTTDLIMEPKVSI